MLEAILKTFAVVFMVWSVWEFRQGHTKLALYLLAFAIYLKV